MLKYSQYLLFKAARSFFQLLSLRSARRAGRVLGRIGYLLLPGRRRLVAGNLARVVPERGRRERRHLAREVFARTGSALIEPLTLMGWDLERAQAHFEVAGREHLDRLLESGRGFLFLGAHFGVWELMFTPVQREVTPLNVLAKTSPNRYLAREVEAIRKRRGQDSIDAAGSALKVFRALRRGERVAVLMDQRVLPADGILLPFLGEASWNSPMLASIALRTGATVLPALCEPVGEDRYKLTIHPPIEPEGEGDDAIYELTARYLRFMEDAIRRRPELWFWVHDRWRRSKQHRWQSTRERLWRLSRLSTPAPPTGRLPPRAREIASLATDVGALERGDGWLVLGGSPVARRQTAESIGRHLIAAGRSFLLADLDAARPLGSEPTPNDPRGLRSLDFFDLVAVISAVEQPTPEQQAALAALVRHRGRLQRSVLLVLSENWPVDLLETERSASFKAGGDGSIGSARTAAANRRLQILGW